MLKIFTTFKLENFKFSFLRFPLCFVYIIATTFLFFLLNNLDLAYNSPTNIMLSKSIATFILVFFFSIGMYLATENTRFEVDKVIFEKKVPFKKFWTESKKSLFQVLPVIFGIIFYTNFNVKLESTIGTTLLLLSLAGIIAFMFFAPYVIFRERKRGLSFKGINEGKVSNSLYYQYFYKTAIVFLFGFVLGGLLFALGNLAIISIQLLFNLEGSFINDISTNWAIISLSFITPFVCLMNLPKDNLKEDKNFELNTFAIFIIKYVLISFIFIYFIILYAYSLKVLLNFNDWPKGEVCWLVIAFSIFGYITYILSYYLENKVKAINIFRKIFPFAVIPQLFMLFYAIYLRINQYDLTINRYFVVVFGIWLLIISLYFIFSKKKNLMIIPAILTLFTIIISVGPGSVYSLPEARQMARLKVNLAKANILQNGKIVPLSDYEDIDKNLSNEIYEGIYYLCHNTDCKSIKKLFSQNVAFTTSEWQIISDITKEIKVNRYYTSSAGNSIDLNPTISVFTNDPMYPIDTTGYFSIVEVFSEDLPKSMYNNQENYGSLHVKVDMENQILQLIQDNKVEENIDISNVITNIYDLMSTEGNYDEKYYNITLPKDKLTFELDGQKYGIKLFISNITLKNPNYKGSEDVAIYKGLNGYALIKEL